jgi:hypothetical protein
LDVVIEFVVNEFTFAIVWFKGKANEFLKFHEYGSRLVTVIYPNGWVMTTLEVPSANRTLFWVEIMIVCGDDKYPTESRTVTVRPG